MPTAILALFLIVILDLIVEFDSMTTKGQSRARLSASPKQEEQE
jgi:hypothetical protein